MLIQDKDLGRIEVTTLPVPEGVKAYSGTYTYSGRVLISGKQDGCPEDPDWYRVFTMNDDGTDVCEVYAGLVPKKKTANGVRWMCYPDNQRILLGDYVLECEPDLDHCTSSQLIPIEYPDEIEHMPQVFCHWSEIIISPDCDHMCWTTLTFTGAICYLGRLVRGEASYHLENVRIVSTMKQYSPDPEHEGFMIQEPVRGGEVKQFVRGGVAVSVAGNGDCLTESNAQHLDTEEIEQITNTPNYEETTMFSPDETLGVVMSPRFSRKTNCAVFGLVPQPNSMAIKAMINVLYMYCVAGVRSFRPGNVGPALIDIHRSMTEGRAYEGVDLSDPEGRWVYCSPLSWSPDSTKAMWNECTRVSLGQQQCRVTIAHLLDRAPSEPVPAVHTPEGDEIPYALPVGTPVENPVYPVKIAGKVSGSVCNDVKQAEGVNVSSSVYENYSDDGETFTNGYLKVTAPASIFAGGKTVCEADMTVTGAHTGEMKLVVTFERDGVQAPSMIHFEPGEDGLPKSRGYARYDGVEKKVEDMER